MRPALVALLLCACSPEPDCITRCGVAVYGSEQCDGAQTIEDESIAIWRRTGWNPQAMCSALSGYMVDVGDEWIKGWNGPVDGRTSLDERTIRLLRFETWGASAYTHELGHVFIREIDGRIEPRTHELWDQFGFWFAETEAKRVSSPM